MTHEHFFREVPGRDYTTLSGTKVIVKRCYCGEEIIEKVEEKEPPKDYLKLNKLTQKRLIFEWIKVYGDFMPSHMAGKVFMGKMFGREN